MGLSYYSSVQTTGQMYGVYGQAGNATNGYNYGVYGRLIGSYNGAGIFGAMRGRSAYNTGGNWAGFFNGNVYMTDNLTVSGTVTWGSDQRIKKNVTILSNNIFNNLSQLNAVSYLYKTRQELKAEGIIPTDTSTAIEAENIFINKTHYGYIAQDVQQVLPELVYEGENGILGIDYIGFIPLIIETIKQQNNRINDLEMQLNNCCKTSSPSGQELKMGINDTTREGSIGNTINIELSGIDQIILYQNEPNPFDGSTVIRYYIPENMQIEANLVFYDSYGNDIKKVEIKETGAGKIEANAQNLAIGIYSYSLIVNGKVMDTKKMIKNK